MATVSCTWQQLVTSGTSWSQLVDYGTSLWFQPLPLRLAVVGHDEQRLAGPEQGLAGPGPQGPRGRRARLDDGRTCVPVRVGRGCHVIRLGRGLGGSGGVFGGSDVEVEPAGLEHLLRQN